MEIRGLATVSSAIERTEVDKSIFTSCIICVRLAFIVPSSADKSAD